MLCRLWFGYGYGYACGYKLGLHVHRFPTSVSDAVLGAPLALGRASMLGGVNLCSSSALVGLARLRPPAAEALFARFSKPLVRWYVVQLLSI